MNRKKILCTAVILVLVFFAVFASVRMWKTGNDVVAVGVGIAEASDTVDQFCQRLNNGDYEGIEDMVNQYSSLNLTELPEDSSNRKLFVCLKDSMSCKTVGECITEGKSASQDISVEFFDMRLADEDIKGYVQSAYDEKLDKAHSNDELYDESGNLLESVAMELYETAVDRVVAAYTEYVRSETFTLELVYEEGVWEIVLSEDLVSILLGVKH